MRCVGDGGSIRRTTLACLIAEQSSLHSLHHSHSEGSTHGLLQSECTLHDKHYHCRYLRDVHAYHYQGYDDISYCHKGHHQTGEMTDATYSSEDDYEGGDGDCSPNPLCVDGERVGKGVA